MAKYKLVFAKRVDQMLLRHTEFLTRVRISAARQFYSELRDILHRMEQNPYQFSAKEDLNLPEGQFRKVLFAKCFSQSAFRKVV